MRRLFTAFRNAGIGRSSAILGILFGISACAGAGKQIETTTSRPIPERLLCNPDGEEEAPAWLNVADHVFVVDEEGRFVDAAVNGDLSEGRNFETQVREVLQAHDRFRQNQGSVGGKNRILIFVNGGLNSIGTSVERAREQVPCMVRAGFFPVFLVWQSSFGDAYWEQISRVRNGRLYGHPRATAPIYFLADIGQGLARAPATYLSQMGNFIDNVDLSLKDITGESEEPAELAPELHVRYDGPSQSLGRFAPNALRFGVTAPFKFLATPFIDAFGKTAWENMVRRTRTTLRKVSEFDPKRRDAEEIRRYPKGTGAFSKFFTELEFCLRGQASCLAPEATASLRDAEITVIGHSMGTMILNEILRRYDELPYRNVVYMGAANSIRRFLENVVPVMESHPDLRFYNLSLHPVADGREVNAQGLIPSGSLLEWVDEMYGGPPTMLDRTLGKWVNVAAAAHIFPEHLRDRMLFRVFGFREPNEAINDPGDPTEHGHLNDTEMHYWLPDFWGKPDDWAY
jgi:hypothetical protein